MIKFILESLFSVRRILQYFFTKTMEKFRDPKTGKFTNISPRNFISLIYIVGIVTFFIVVGSQLFSGKSYVSSGLDEYKKELTPKIGINAAMSNMTMEADPMGDLLRGVKEKELTKGIDPETSAASPPSKDECLMLMDRVQKGDELQGEDKIKMNTCLDKNIGQWSEDQISFANALVNDSSLTPEEKAFLRKGIAGELSPEEMALAKALVGKDPKAKELARQAIQLNDEEAKKALASALSGKKINEQEKEALKGILSAAADKLGSSSKDLLSSLLGTSGGGASPAGAPGANGSDGLNAEQLKAMAAEMAAKEQELRALEQSLAEAQAAASKAGQNLSQGKLLSSEENAAIARLAEIQKQLDGAKKEQEKRRIVVLRATSKLQQALAGVASTIEQTVPSGFFVAYEDVPPVDCKTVAKTIAKQIPRVKKVYSRKPGDEIILGLDGKPLSPDKVKLISLRRKKMYELDRTRNAILDPTGSDQTIGRPGLPGELIGRPGLPGELIGTGSSGQNSPFTSGSQPVDVAALFSGESGTQPTELTQHIVYTNKALKQFAFTPDMKIPAVLLNTVLVSDKGRPQVVRVKVLDDVYNPESNERVIPKGSIIVGSTSSFDAETGIMDMSFEKVSIGSGKVLPARFTVGSADGSMGLRGQIRDTRGKYLLGAFITSFSSGALNWFSQSVVTTFTQQTDPANALLGAGMAGGAEVMTKIAEMFASDLQNAAKIYYAPKGIPIILYPSE